MMAAATVAVSVLNADGAVLSSDAQATLTSQAASSALGGGVILVPTSYSDPRAFPSMRWCCGASEALAAASSAAGATSSRAAERLRALDDDELLGSAFAARPPRSSPVLLCVPRDANARFLVERSAAGSGGLARMGYACAGGGASQRPPFSVVELRRIATIENEARISPVWQVLFASIESSSVKWSSVRAHFRSAHSTYRRRTRPLLTIFPRSLRARLCTLSSAIRHRRVDGRVH
jgi:hypothetical protein